MTNMIEPTVNYGKNTSLVLTLLPIFQLYVGTTRSQKLGNRIIENQILSENALQVRAFWDTFFRL